MDSSSKRMRKCGQWFPWRKSECRWQSGVEMLESRVQPTPFQGLAPLRLQAEPTQESGAFVKQASVEVEGQWLHPE